MNAYFKPEYINLPYSNKVLEWGKEYPVEGLADAGRGGYAHVKRIGIHEDEGWAKCLPPLVIKCSNERFSVRDLNRYYTDKESELSQLHEQMLTEWLNHYRIGNADGHAPEPYAFGELHESSEDREYVRLAILMSWVDGVSLDEAISRLSANGGTSDARKTARLGLLVAEAIRKLHEKDVAHRDLSPNNILVSPSDATHKPKVTLLDFGISVTLKSDKEQITQDLLPTYAYGAPEECRSFTDDPNFVRDGFAADCWSLGAILYHIRTNETPHGEAMSNLAGDYVTRGIRASRIKEENALDYPCEDEEDKELRNLIQSLTKFQPTERPSVEAAIGRLSRILGIFDAPSGMTDKPDHVVTVNKDRTIRGADTSKALKLFDEAMDILSRGPISMELAHSAVDKLKEAARLNNVDACKKLAYIYLHSSNIVPRNYEEAAKLYQKAADADDAEAQYELALLCQSGLGVPRDPKRASELFDLSAQKGNIHAKTKVAERLTCGNKRDYRQALEYLTDAANAGDANALFNLGVFYDEGYEPGKPRDFHRAFECYRAAAKQGHVAGITKVAQYYRHALGPCKKDLRKAAQILESVAESGNWSSVIILADIYDDRGFDGYDPFRAVSLYERAAPYSRKAQYLLADHLIKGEGIPASRERAAEILISLLEKEETDTYASFGLQSLRDLHREGIPAGLSGEWRVRMMRLLVGEDEPANTIELAASLVCDGPRTSTRDSEEAYKLLAPLEQGNAEAAYWLGMMHYHGLVQVAGYREEATRLFSLAANGKHDGACIALAECLLAGHGADMDAKKAAEQLQAAAGRGNAAAQVRLAKLYEEGVGVERDCWEALRLYRKAADQDDDEAMYCIGRLYESSALEQEPNLPLAREWYNWAAEKGNKEAAHALQNMSVDELA